MRIRTLAVPALVVTLLSLAPATLAHAAGPALSLSPTFGPPTTSDEAKGAGFPAADSVTVTFDGASVASATTSSTGTFTAGYVVPATALPGAHTVSAFDSAGLGAGATFTVQTSWNSARFDQAGSGFNPYENVLSPTDLGNLSQLAAPQWGAFLHSEPAYYNGILYAGSSDGTARAFDPLSGHQRWSFSAGGAVDGSPAVVVPKAGHAACAVVVASTSGTVYGLDPSRGTELWNVNLGGGPISGSPILVTSGTQQVGQNVVMVTDDGTVALIHACTGRIGYEVLVDYQEGDPDTPIVLNKVPLSDGSVHTIVVVTSGAGTLALDEPTGNILWNVSVPCGSPPCSPADFGSGKGARIVVGSGSSLDLLNAGTGAVVWSRQMPAQVSGIGLFETPLAGSVNRFTMQSIIAGDQAGDVYALSPKTGAKLWSERAPGPPGSPAIANGVVYVERAPGPNGDGALVALDAASGNPLFSADLGARGPGPAGSPSPAVADGRVYTGDFTGGVRVFGLPT